MQSNVTTSHPLPGAISVDSKTDLIGYIHDQWLAGKPTEQTVEKFVEFARKWTTENVPIGLDHMTAGIGFRFADGRVLRYNAEPKKPSFQPTAIGITG